VSAARGTPIRRPRRAATASQVRPRARRGSARRRGAALALALLVVAGCRAEDAPPPPRQILLVVLDATHAAHLSGQGGPRGLTTHLERLAARGLRFTRAVSNTTWTLPSTVSLMTGELQETHGVVTNRHRAGDEQVLAAERFADAGYRTAAFVQMVYASDSYGLDQGFDDYRYYGFDEPGERTRLFADVREWMDAHADERWFLYLHLRRPHSPYDPDPLSLAAVEASTGGPCPLADGRDDAMLAHVDARPGLELDAEQAAHARHLYQANLALVDTRLGEILRRLEGRDDALVVVTSDHGEALGEHGAWGHGAWLWAECVDVPLIVAGPGVRVGTDDAVVSTIDVLPTLVEWCGLAPDRFDGVSVAARWRGESGAADRVVPLSARYTGRNTPAQGAIRGDLKLILGEEGEARLFDRRADPADRRDVSARHEETAALLRLARERRAAFVPEPPGEGPTLEDERADDLRALGYAR